MKLPIAANLVATAILIASDGVNADGKNLRSASTEGDHGDRNLQNYYPIDEEDEYAYEDEFIMTRKGPNGNAQGNGRPNADGSCGKRNNPVCVDGEITFQNPCLAEAQGEMDYTNGPCAGQDANFQGSGAATGEEMGRFKEEGFRLVGKVLNDVKGSDPLEAVEEDEDDDEKNPPGQMKKLTRVTPDGLKYVAKEHVPGRPFDNNNNGNSYTPNAHPLFEENDGFPSDEENGRNLQIGTDSRSKVSSTSVYPYWRLGEVDWSGEGGCSGSIVGPNKVLVAAHCVFDTYSNQWQVPSRFAPGRYRQCWEECPWYLFGGCRTRCETREPWGVWPVQYATIPSSFINYQPATSGTLGMSGIGSDVAILTMGTNWAGNIGSYMGTLPIIAAPCSIHADSTTAGYPGSKPDGEMWTSGKCEWWGSGCDSNRVISNTCDVTPGQSGSAVYDNYKRIFGIVSAGSSYRTYFFGFNESWKNWVLTW